LGPADDLLYRRAIFAFAFDFGEQGVDPRAGPGTRDVRMGAIGGGQRKTRLSLDGAVGAASENAKHRLGSRLEVAPDPTGDGAGERSGFERIDHVEARRRLDFETQAFDRPAADLAGEGLQFELERLGRADVLEDALI